MTSSFAPETEAPIGVFDSGLGGLTVVREMARDMPTEAILFLADQAHVPYGGRDLSEVRGFAVSISDGLFQAGCKAVVMACNISSATALTAVRARHPGALVLGVIEPGARAAVELTRNGRVGVLATAGTVTSGAYTQALRALHASVSVSEVACPEFVPLVEAGALETPSALRAAETYLAPLIAFEADTIILGCTHYPFLLPLLQRIAPGVDFVNPALETVAELKQRLAERHATARRFGEAPVDLATTGDPAPFQTAAGRILPCVGRRSAYSAAHWSGGLLGWRSHDAGRPAGQVWAGLT